ncbi:hypothetical protein FIV42_06340 [Persicimonas caeni]|uniref:Uncharacterized protein n=1 Tax=Persicimonas caeni TaxID=2292766 RepID=A0A4Y6PPW4_PERCE|nr:hypothetical protein [Persicimonas caeni]QDG50364.1 hypothetical protein FIV42_06340 [Persicimonas caeni]QED31585.1 hypothetical protein FRD00_06335 [Persicimonas caeni]
MERKSWKSKTQNGIIVVILLLVAYFALTDEHGKFSVPSAGGLAVQRVGDGFESMITAVAETTKEKNREMQQVHDNYERRTADRVEDNGGEAP